MRAYYSLIRSTGTPVTLKRITSRHGTEQFVAINFPSVTLEEPELALTGTPGATACKSELGPLERLLNGLPDPLLLKDQNRRYIFVNDAMCILLGRTRDELLGCCDADLFPAEHAQAYFAADDLVMATGQETDFEEELTLSEGNTRIVKTRKRSLSVPGLFDAEPVLMVSLLDITEVRRAEVELRESEQRFRVMADGVPVMIWMTDAEGVTTFVNKLWLTVTGQKYDEALGHSWLETVHPDDRSRVGQNFETARERQTAFQVEYRLRRADGTWAWVLDIAEPRFTIDRTFQGYVGSCLDITERRQIEAALRESEEHYRYSVELDPSIRWLADPQGNIIDLSSRWCELTGISREEALGRGWSDALHPDDAAPTATRWQVVLASGALADFEFRLRTASGQYRWFRSRAAPRYDEVGTIIRWYGASEDIHEHKLAALALQEREGQLQTIFNSTSVGILHHDPTNRIIMVNDRYCQILGRSREALDGISLIQFTHPDDAAWQNILLEEHYRTGEPLRLEKRYVRPDGSIVWCNVNISFVPDEAGIFGETITIAEDITARKEAETRAREVHNLLQDVIDSVDDLIFVKDAGGRYMFANKKFGGLEVVGKVDQELFPQEAETFRDSDQYVMTTGNQVSIEEALTHNRDRFYHTVKAPWRNSSGIIGVIGISRDITERKQTEERMRWAAHHDELTGLSNRRLFQAKIKAAFDEASAAQRPVGLLAMDVDHFKQINDRFGHDTGDALLKAFAERLRQAVGDRGLIARLGGDEFSVLLPNVVDETDLSRAARDILEHMHQPLSFAGNALDCRTSIGGAMTQPGQNEEPDGLSKRADLALYASKAAGRSVFTMFRPSMLEEQQKVASALRVAGQAVAFDWIVPHYQPKVDLESGQLAGFEALLRWNHPRAGIQSPESISPAFDNTDLGVAIGERIRFCVLQHLRSWRDTGTEIGRIAVNASSAEFRRDDYAERVLEELSRAELPTRYLEVEVTEGVFLGYGSDFVARALHKLSSAGVTIALDDFGTGYASLSHLKEFPVDVIKIDRSFVKDVALDGSDAAVVKAVLSLGQNLGVEVVAEGVETAAQAAFLRKEGCSTAQGFFFARPMAHTEVGQFISVWQGRRFL